MMTASASVLLVNVLTALFKKHVYPRWGRTGVQVTVFALAFMGALYITYGEGFRYIVENTIAIFSLAVTLYEVLLSRLRLFKEGV